MKDVNNRQHSEIEHLNEKLVDEARRNKSLERDSDRLRSEISLLESKVQMPEMCACKEDFQRKYLLMELLSAMVELNLKAFKGEW